MNTRFGYMYRDADNYKAFREIIVAGPLEETTLRQHLEDGCYFIPDQIGLEELQAELSGFPNDSDHVWHELAYLEETSAPTNTPRTAADLLSAIQRAATEGWDEAGAMDRLGIA